MNADAPELRVDDLYQEIILDHNRRPRNFRAIEGGRTAEGFNPLCGDRLTVYVRLEGDVIADISFLGSGCAISKASASLMTESVKGKTIADAEALFSRVQRMITAAPDSPAEPVRIGDGFQAVARKLTALAGVRQFPARVKCAGLAWHTLHAALQARREMVSTE
jgi:nitrogen fixation NifU-like protein